MNRLRKNQQAAANDKVLGGVAPVFRVLGHVDRLRIVNLLLQGDLSVGEVADTVRLAPNAVSQHLGILAAHRIVERVRDGRKVICRIAHPAVRPLVECVYQHAGDL